MATNDSTKEIINTTSHTKSIWVSQIISIFRLEVRKNFFGKRTLLIYIVVAMTILLFAVIAIHPITAKNLHSFGQINSTFAQIYEQFLLRTLVFYGCAWIFMNLFRAELIDKSLHYYLLSSVRREILIIGKYISGLIVSIILFSITSIVGLCFLYFSGGIQEGIKHLIYEGGFNQLISYVGITTLGCIGYGAIFLVIGLFLRNPIIPAILISGWETINFLLPSLLKKISIIYYLHSLMPIPIEEHSFAIITEPVSTGVAVVGLLSVSAIVLIIASFRIRHLEIRYGVE